MLVLADAYRAGMNTGHRELPSNGLEIKVLQALLAQSAMNSLVYVRQSLPNGRKLGKPLEALAEDLQEGNVVGRTLQSVIDNAAKQGRAVAWTVISTGTAPIWVGTAVSVILGLFFHAQNFGRSIGNAIAFALFAALTVIAAVGFFAFRALAVAAQSLTRGLSQIGEVILGVASGISGLWATIDSIGSSAQAIYLRDVAPVRKLVLPSAPAVPVPIVSDLRSLMKIALVLTCAFALAAIIYFVSGVYQAFQSPPSAADCAVNSAACNG